ncbi:hypothetical protein AAV35_009725 [Salimicrobium jeotgali]|uniref:Uncharacterized protein n=1 Tax=Salimicrobium jeotgali TaxID=1230341 RepID=K2H456_9BACI|nr:hypothetical protein [Salimicrobium jeotgali]AKG05055.1 hypothetical protein AAV35_009725 [Salimicrobium jeotgali]EKE30635.1 hypothetical protein MJ3_12430 [Salimicrobium jeotgali]MBM7696870.1 putative membrane protein [Salimicrobium jeotgali]
MAMKERTWLRLTVGGIFLLAFLILLSIVTMETASVQRVYVTLSEVTGVMTLVMAVTAVTKDERRKWIFIGTASFLVTWAMLAVAYEIGLGKDSSAGWLWFFLYYVIALVTIIILKKSVRETPGKELLFPVTLLFFAGIQLVYVFTVHIFWNLPF